MAAGLLGTWSATRWQYLSRHHDTHAVDLVCDLRGAVTLSLSPGTFILSWDIPGHGSRTVGGQYVVRERAIEFASSAKDVSDAVWYRLGVDELSLQSEESAWDFGDGAEELALFVAVFVRI